MLVRTAKRIANGEKITKVVVWDSMGQEAGESAEVRRSAMILRDDTGRYHEDALEDEEGYRLSTVLNTDMVLEIWTAEGKVWDSKITTHWGALNTRIDSRGNLTWRKD